MNRNLVRFQIQREINEKVSVSFQRGMQINDSIIKRLGCIHELQVGNFIFVLILIY